MNKNSNTIKRLENIKHGRPVHEGINESTPASDCSPHDWPEDFNHENGNYQNRCCQCEVDFAGYKRRVVCKACNEDNEKAWNALSEPERQNAIAKTAKAIHDSIDDWRVNPSNEALEE